MKVGCDKCGASFDVDDKRIPATGLTMKCPKCFTSFKVMPSAPASPDPRSRTILGVGIKFDPAKPAPFTVSAAPPVPPADHSGTASQDTDLFVRRFTGRVFGPFPVDTIKKMLAEKKLDGTETVSMDRKTWVPLKVHPAFKAGPASTSETSAPELPVAVLKPTSDLPIPPRRKRSEELETPEPLPLGPADEVLVKKRERSDPELPVPKEKGFKPAFPAPPPPPTWKRQDAASEPELPAVISKPGRTGSEPELPTPMPGRSGSEPELPAPRSVGIDSRPELPVSKAEGVPHPPKVPPKAGGIPPLPPLSGGARSGRQDRSIPLSTEGDRADLPVAKATPADAVPLESSVELSGLDLPVPAGTGPSAPSNPTLEIQEADLLEPKESFELDDDRFSGARELDTAGSEPLELAEDDLLVLPDSSTDLKADLPVARVDEEQKEKVKRAAKESFGTTAPTASFFSRYKKIILIGGAGLVAVILVIAGMKIFSGKTEDGRKAKAGSRGKRKAARALELVDLSLDTPESYRSAFLKVKNKLDEKKDPAMLAAGITAVLCNAYRYGEKKKDFGWARKAMKGLGAPGPKAPKEVMEAFGLEALVNGQVEKAVSHLAQTCPKNEEAGQGCVFLGWARMEQGRPRTAAKIFERTLKATPKSAAAAFGLGWALSVTGDLKGAKGNLQKALKLSSGHMEARLELQRIKLLLMMEGPYDLAKGEKGQAEEARKLVEAAARSGSSSLKMLKRLVQATLEQALGNEDRALKILGRAAKKSSDIRILLSYFQGLLSHARVSETLELMEKVMKVHGKSKEFAVLHAMALLRSSKAEEALSVVQGLTKKWPNDPKIRVTRGLINLARGKPDSAIKYYKQALALNPRYVPAYVAWIELRLESRERKSGALAQIELLASQGVSHPDLQELKARVLLAQKELEKALQSCQKVVQSRPAHNSARVLLGRILLAMGQMDKAKAELDLVWKRAKGRKGVALALAEYYRKLGVAEKARKILEEGARRRPTLELKVAAAQALLKEGDPKMVARAEKMLGELLRSRPQDASVRLAMGQAMIRSNNIKEALIHLKKAISLDPRNMETRLAMAQALVASHKVNQALAVLKQALAVDPKASSLLEYRARIRFERGGILPALEDLKQALAISPTPSAYTLQAECFIERQKSSRALKSLDQALKLNPRFPRAHFIMGRTQFRQGKLNKAVKTLRKALTVLEDARADWVADAHYMLGSAYVDLRKKPLAKKHLNAYLKMTEKDSSRKSTRKEALRKLKGLGS